jgi:hypothetical protein
MISAYFSISQIEKPYEIWSFFLGISPTFHQRVTFVALGSTGAPACNFATQSSSEWPSLPAPARTGATELTVGMVWNSQAIRPQLHVDF